jgi:hypothetical protein
VIGANTPAAMRHAWNHEQTIKVIEVPSRLAGGHGIAVVDRFAGDYKPIGPTVIHEQFITVTAKRREIRTVRINGRAKRGLNGGETTYPSHEPFNYPQVAHL